MTFLDLDLVLNQKSTMCGKINALMSESCRKPKERAFSPERGNNLAIK